MPEPRARNAAGSSSEASSVKGFDGGCENRTLVQGWLLGKRRPWCPAGLSGWFVGSLTWGECGAPEWVYHGQSPGSKGRLSVASQTTYRCNRTLAVKQKHTAPAATPWCKARSSSASGEGCGAVVSPSLTALGSNTPAAAHMGAIGEPHEEVVLVLVFLNKPAHGPPRHEPSLWVRTVVGLGASGVRRGATGVRGTLSATDSDARRHSRAVVPPFQCARSEAAESMGKANLVGFDR